jgi:transposase-like protein
MKMIDLLEVIQDEKRSEDFLRSRGVLKTFTHCYKCNSTKVGMTRSDRWKCYSCEAEWTRRKDSILSLVRMKYSEFLLCMKLFELELTAEETAAQLKLNYKTVVQIFREIRILLSDESKIIKSSKGTFLGKKIEELGIYSSGEKFYFDFNGSNKSNVALLKLERHRITDSAVILDSTIRLLKTTNTKSIFDLPPVFQRFARYLKEKLFKFRGTDRYYLHLYLREIEFRFNNQKVDVFDRLVEIISKEY